MRTTDEKAKEMQERSSKLYEQLTKECGSSADMGLLLCTTLMVLIILVEGRANDKHTIGDLTQKFILAEKLRESLTTEKEGV